MRAPTLTLLILSGWMFGWLPAPTLAAEQDFFVEQVAPILARRCLSCHDDANSGGGLSLADPSALIEDGYVVPQDAGASHLIGLIRGGDDRPQMPKDADPLSDHQLETIEQWIRSGAAIPNAFHLRSLPIVDHDWWSLQPLPSHAAPLSSDDIDRAVDRRITELDLKTLPEAEPQTLIRRLTYDLHGLPPTPDAIDRFVAAYRRHPRQAWSELVDRLLASAEFGEKWGQHWLDLARYAETHGYDKDQPRDNAWPYRDYVIGSFNKDTPYAEFARQQIAGDSPTGVGEIETSADGIVATGFLAAGPWDLIAHKEVGEAKLDGRIAKHLDRDEMVSAVFNVFQSTTIQCAQCHDHKFDPIPSRDYYRLHAVFADVDRADRIYTGLSPEQLAEKSLLENETDALVRRRDQERTRLSEAIAGQTGAIQPEIDRLMKEADTASPPEQHGFHSTIAASADETKWVQVELERPERLDRIELLACYDDFNDIGAGFGFPVRFKVEVSTSSIGGADTQVVLDSTDQDFANPGGSTVAIPCEDRPIRVIRLTASKLAERKADFILALGELRAIRTVDGKNIASSVTVSASDHIPPNSRWAPQFLVDDQFYRWTIDNAQVARLATLTRKRQSIIDRLTTDAYRESQTRLNGEIDELRRRIEAFPNGKQVFAVASDFKPSGKFVPTKGVAREIRFLNRGDLRLPGDPVLPGAPELWPDAADLFSRSDEMETGDARPELARYVTHRDNPLFWRSIANRVWQWTMGKPIVATPNDFGRMGAMPTHPELLDRLAVELRDDPNQSIKSLVRLLVETRAYRRASFDQADGRAETHNIAIDQGNNSLWRANRRRLTAEEFRDTILAVSGSLRVAPRGGPSFRDFVIERPQHSPHYEYRLHDPDDVSAHRRTIYRFVVRSQPQPMLTTLDCADPSISVPRRDESTTALQALAQWNNRLVEVMSKRFAERLAASTKTAPDAIDLACRLAWGRRPSADEHALLSTLAKEHGRETLCRVVLNASPMMYLD